MRRILVCAAVAAAVLLMPALAGAACCYFSAKNVDILQPAQKVFITWDPVKKIETFTVQPKFEGNALDFGMVIPTPSQPKLHEMPRDYFKHLAVYTIMKRREFPHSKLLHILEPPRPQEFVRRFYAADGALELALPPIGELNQARKPEIKILEVGTVGSLEYKIIEA